MTLFLDLWNTTTLPPKVSFPLWDNTCTNKLWVARMKKKKKKWIGTAVDEWLLISVLYFSGRKDRKKENKKKHSRSSYCFLAGGLWFGWQVCEPLPSSDCRTPWVTWASAASAQTEWNLSACPRWFWAPALWLWSASFKVNGKHTHTQREPSEAFLKLFGLFIHLKTDSELTTISVLVHNFLLFACPQDVVVAVVFVFFVF